MQASATRAYERLTVGTDEVSLRVTSADSAGALLAFEVRMAPGGGPQALHRHDPAELYRVERDEFAFYVAGEDGQVIRSVIGPGDVVAIPGGREHTVRNESSAESSAFVVFAPGVEFERVAHGIELTRSLEEIR